MLKYIWTVIQDLFLAVTFAALMRPLIVRRSGRTGLRMHRAGIIAGVVSAIALAAVKNTTNRIVSSRWNHSIYVFIIGLTVLFVILALASCRDRADGEEGVTALSVSAAAAGSALTAVWIFYALPGAIAYPFTFNTMGNGYRSWYFFSRLIGWLLAFLILFLYAWLLARCAAEIKKTALAEGALIISLLASAFYCLCRFFVPWVNRAKWLRWPVKYDAGKHGFAGELVKLSSRHAMTFIWIAAILAAALALAFFFENVRLTEPYDNPAEHRKLRAGNRRRRRTAVALAIFLGVCVISMSVIKDYDLREVVLSEPETFTVGEDRILVPMESVSDGHLHRFEYRTDNEVNVRWIVVKKPGSASFGVGLDACEVCGNAGYYERNGQVICKRCDVVMNINTIGFKGGCNPIPLPYEVQDGNLVFLLEDLIAGEKEFK